MGAKRDWARVDAAAHRRGTLIGIFISPDAALFARPSYAQRTGTPKHFSDQLIETFLMARAMMGLSYREVEALARQINAKLGVTVPDHSTLCRRMRTLSVKLPHHFDPARRHVIVVDSTGVKVFGEGEWKVRSHGKGYRRTWKKLHLATDYESGEIVGFAVTSPNTHDCTVLPKLLPDDIEGDYILGDGAYHSRKLYRYVHRRGGALVSPPPKNARRWRPHHRCRDEPAFRARNLALTRIQRCSRRRWSIESGYSRRSFAESTNHRLKSATGDRMASRTADRQVVEMRMRCQVLNMTCTPRPITPTEAPAARPQSVRQLIRNNGLRAAA